ncbi:MAG TPA: hypothetical protein VMX16_04420 [Terriglobia bacterium]|nr:hypothetical protein [Terriglobia bacterium]
MDVAAAKPREIWQWRNLFAVAALYERRVEFLHLAGQLAIPSPSPAILSPSPVILSDHSLAAAHHWQKLDASPEESEC